MKNLVMILPHCSTGGMPAYVLKYIQYHKDKFNITVIEVNNYSNDYIVQRNKIKEECKLIQLNGDQLSLLIHLEELKPDLIHFQELPETFLEDRIIASIYRIDKVIKRVTTHNSLTKGKDFKFLPNEIIAVNKWQQDLFKTELPSVKTDIWEYPIEKNYKNTFLARPQLSGNEYEWLVNQYKNYGNYGTSGGLSWHPIWGNVGTSVYGKPKYNKHILNVGLFTPGKNQGELFEIARQNPNNCYHFVGNQAENFRNYWEPLMKNKPDNCIIWGERDDVDLFYQACDEFYFTSKFELNPIVIKEALSYGLPVKMRKLPTYGNDYDNNPLVTYIKEEEIKQPILNFHFVNGCYIQLLNWPEGSYNIIFKNKKTDEILHEANITGNSWAKCNFQYFVDWEVMISKDGRHITTLNQNLENQNVFISIDSKSLGDTIAWFPYTEEFRKKHKCNLIVSTHHNYLFEGQYPEIKFIKPGELTGNILAQYNIGWFYNGEKIDRFRNPHEVKDQPMQKTASDILGLSFKEIRPKINFTIKYCEVDQKKFITIANHSTLQAKYWNSKYGWEMLIERLKHEGYKVVLLSKEENGFMGNENPKNVEYPSNHNIETIMNLIYHSKFFIGIGSGLSWLAWALGKKVILISGFSEGYTEMLSNTIRITAPEGSCSGCFNRVKLENNAGWDWCPDHKDTERQFECSKNISPFNVINRISHLI